jgi:hypothetical protein
MEGIEHQAYKTEQALSQNESRGRADEGKLIYAKTTTADEQNYPTKSSWKGYRRNDVHAYTDQH